MLYPSVCMSSSRPSTLPLVFRSSFQPSSLVSKPCPSTLAFSPVWLNPSPLYIVPESFFSRQLKEILEQFRARW